MPDEPLRVLDTDHLSLAQRNHPQVVARLRALPADQRATTVITAEEQLRGRLAVLSRAREVTAWQTGYAAFQETLASLNQILLLPFDEAAAAQFIALRPLLRQFGTQDLKISAIVLAVNGVLVTCNRRDFGRIPGLVLEDWT